MALRLTQETRDLWQRRNERLLQGIENAADQWRPRFPVRSPRLSRPSPFLASISITRRGWIDEVATRREDAAIAPTDRLHLKECFA